MYGTKVGTSSEGPAWYPSIIPNHYGMVTLQGAQSTTGVEGSLSSPPNVSLHHEAASMNAASTSLEAPSLTSSIRGGDVVSLLHSYCLGWMSTILVIDQCLADEPNADEHDMQLNCRLLSNRVYH